MLGTKIREGALSTFVLYRYPTIDIECIECMEPVFAFGSNMTSEALIALDRSILGGIH